MTSAPGDGGRRPAGGATDAGRHRREHGAPRHDILVSRAIPGAMPRKVSAPAAEKNDLVYADLPEGVSRGMVAQVLKRLPDLSRWHAEGRSPGAISVNLHVPRRAVEHVLAHLPPSAPPSAPGSQGGTAPVAPPPVAPSVATVPATVPATAPATDDAMVPATVDATDDAPGRFEAREATQSELDKARAAGPQIAERFRRATSLSRSLGASTSRSARSSRRSPTCSTGRRRGPAGRGASTSGARSSRGSQWSGTRSPPRSSGS